MEPIYTTLINRILSIFCLEWTKIGLVYTHKLKYGEIRYFVSNDFNLVLKLLDLPKTNSNDVELLSLLIFNSKYFNKRLFTSYKTNNEEYIKFTNLIEQQRPINMHSSFLLDKLDIIDKHFNTTLSLKTFNLNKIGLDKRELRNKFNYKLVMKWSKDLKQGTLLVETVEEFKLKIEKENECGFLDYLKSTKPSKVKSDFEQFYFALDFILGIKTNLPF